MPRLFTVSWPYFARLEAALCFPPAVMLAGGTGWLAPFAGDGMVQSLSQMATQSGLPRQAGFWADQAILMLAPWLLLSIVIDRFMTIRKGYAILSLLAVAAWTGAAYALSDRLEPFVPPGLTSGIDWLPFKQQAALAVAGIALFVHLKPLLTGLLDQGGVAARLLSPRGGPGYDRVREYDPYRMQRPDMRMWRSPNAYAGHTYVPKENPAAKFLYAITWVGLLGAAGCAWLIWSGRQPAAIVAAVPGLASIPGLAAATNSAARAMSSSAPPSVPSEAARLANAAGGPPLPVAEAASPDVQAPNAYVTPRMPIPVVQRPGPLPSVVLPSTTHPGVNEATAARGRDGHFTFDATVNGVHVPMLFDTGASVVSLRAEDAVRMGFDLSELKFTKKMSTANGIALYAPIIIDTISIGDITEQHVAGLVAKPGVLAGNLLGQSFMGRLAGYDVESNQLVLKGR